MGWSNGNGGEDLVRSDRLGDPRALVTMTRNGVSGPSVITVEFRGKKKKSKVETFSPFRNRNGNASMYDVCLSFGLSKSQS